MTARAGQGNEELYYGRAKRDWAAMLRVTEAYLAECAAGNCETDYTAVNHRIDRERLPAFRFDREADRAAMGRLLGEISVWSYEDHGIMLSALVRQSGGTSVGKGFWTLAEELGAVPEGLTPRQKSVELKRLTRAVKDHYRQSR
ncbi:hypothetical protein GCM10011374_34200 [Kocuria dechangensis]|uniref:Uncharacterized protein n=1 Tax=Kocuria dechangensis TaxID=1176249 RepID=A0A917H497_9MICC|nr:hypothetical protein [Kocuria dechangensis]GGG67154.1 hypothetical protein GCM10011374_34200 [Kocuria dechangensis]